MIHSNSNKAQWRGDISLVHSPGKQPGRKGIFNQLGNKQCLQSVGTLRSFPPTACTHSNLDNILYHLFNDSCEEL